MRRRAGTCSGWMRDIVAWGCRPAGRGDIVVATSPATGGTAVAVVVAAIGMVAGGGGGGGTGTGMEGLGCLSFAEEGGGATYAGCLGRKKFRIEGWPLALEEGSDMMCLDSLTTR